MADASNPAATGAPVKSYPLEVTKRLEALHTLQKTYSTARSAFMEERKALEVKYLAQYADLYKQRAEIVRGEVDPASAPADAIKGVPAFWLTAFKNSKKVSDFIEESDEPALEFLQDVRLEYLDDFAGFRIVFAFAPNPYFEDATLTKSFVIKNMFGSDEGGEPSVEKLEGCDIHWKAGKNLTVKIVKKTVKKKGKKTTQTKEEDVPSFFRFFETPDMETEPQTAEEAYELYEQVQAESECGFALRNKIIPNAVAWFTGEAVDDDDDDDEDEDDEEYDDDEGDEDEDEEEEEEEEAPKPKKGGKGGKGGKKAAKDEDAEGEDDAETRAALAAAFAKNVSTGGEGGEDKPAECKKQ